MEPNRQVEAAGEARRASLEAQHDAANTMTVEERDKAARLKLYQTLEARAALDIYYQLYPDERPKTGEHSFDRTRDDGGRER